MERKIGMPLPELAEYCRVAAAEGAVLLKNEEQVLPLEKGTRVSIFGRCQIEYYRSGTGSGGAVNVAYVKNILDELRKTELCVNETLAKSYEAWLVEHPFDNGGGGWAMEPWFQKEMPITKELAEEASKASDVAIFIIGRTAGEDKDNKAMAGSYYLTEEELANLKMVSAYFSKVIVLLNVSNIIDMGFLDFPEMSASVKAVMYIWQGGMEGGAAVADLLTAAVTPSGKLTDTIAYSIEDYPATKNFGSHTANIYQEDIYVGYRYFETFCPDKVRFEFGFGLSYTTFERKVLQSEVCGEGLDANLQIKVQVTNKGDYSGKEVIQVYVSAPQGVLGKPTKALVEFAKTENLKPGEAEVLSFAIPISKLASYDDSGITGYKSCYVLEAGTYEFYVGNSVKNVEKVDKVYELTDLIVVEKLQEALAPEKSFLRMKPGVKKADGSYELCYVETPKCTVDRMERIIASLPKELHRKNADKFLLQQVVKKEVSLEDFVAQLSLKELATLVRGEGMSSPKVTPGTASAFGGVGDNLYAYGIPVACCADGPSGIRMESGLLATQLPIGTLLASSFNIPMMRDLYVLEGKELYQNEIDTLLGPGMNLHRHPLNGRNFEYFSEDPLVTGRFAAAAVRGIELGGSHATIKHFAGNNQETARFTVDTVASERALRELYLKGFEIAVKEGGALSIMTSYNPINGHWTASNFDLNTTILRDEWGYKGMVMTDWWAQMNDCVNGGVPKRNNLAYMVRAQNDVYMVINNNGAEINSSNDDIEEAVEKGYLTIGELQRSAKNILKFILESPVMERPLRPVNPIKSFESMSLNRFKEWANAEDKRNLLIHRLTENPKVQIKEATEVTIQVEMPGTYNAIVKMMSPMTNLSQSSTNAFMNGEHFATIQTCGTDGQWITEKMMQVKLNEGYYNLRLQEIKPGIEIEYLAFELV